VAVLTLEEVPSRPHGEYELHDDEGNVVGQLLGLVAEAGGTAWQVPVELGRHAIRDYGSGEEVGTIKRRERWQNTVIETDGRRFTLRKSFFGVHHHLREGRTKLVSARFRGAGTKRVLLEQHEEVPPLIALAVCRLVIVAHDEIDPVRGAIRS
jgi:hypothetical protein